MNTMSDAEAHARFGELPDSIAECHEEVVIAGAARAPVIVLPLSEYESLRETAYLLDATANARRLLDAVDRLER